MGYEALRVPLTNGKANGKFEDLLTGLVRTVKCGDVPSVSSPPVTARCLYRRWLAVDLVRELHQVARMRVLHNPPRLQTT